MFLGKRAVQLESLPKQWAVMNDQKMRFIWVRDWESRVSDPSSPKAFETEGYMIASAPHGGIVVTCRLSPKSSFSRRINVFSGALQYITTIKLAMEPKQWNGAPNEKREWYTCAPVSFIGVTAEEIIVVLMANCTVLFFTVSGMLVGFAKLKDKNGEERKRISPPRIVRFNGRSLAVITRDQDFLFMADIWHPVWEFVSAHAELGPESIVAKVVMQAIDFDFVCPPASSGSTVPLIWAVDSNGTLTSSRGLDVGSPLKTPTCRNVAVSPSGEQLAILTCSKQNLAVSFAPIIDVKKSVVVRCEFLTEASFASIVSTESVEKFVWCGEDAVALVYSTHAVFVNKKGEMYFIDELSKPIVAVPEIDGLRLIYKNPGEQFGHHKFVSYVRCALGKLFKLGTPHRKLIEFYGAWINGRHSTLQWPSGAKYDVLKKLYEAAKGLTGCECRELLEVIRCGCCALASLQSGGACTTADAFIKMNSALFEVVECVRNEFRHKILITAGELEYIGFNTFIKLLTNRGMFRAAEHFTTLLAIQNRDIATSELLTKIVTSMQKGKDELPPIPTGAHINYACVATAAYFCAGNVDRKSTVKIIETLLKEETVEKRKIPVYVLLGQYDLAKEKALTLGDTTANRWVMKSAIEHGHEESSVNYEGYDIQGSLAEFDASPLDVLLFRLKCLDRRNLVTYVTHVLKKKEEEVSGLVFELLLERLKKFKENFYVICLKRWKEFSVIQRERQFAVLQDTPSPDEEDADEQNAGDDEGDRPEGVSQDEASESQAVKKKKHKKKKHKKKDSGTSKPNVAPTSPAEPQSGGGVSCSQQHLSIFQHLEQLLREGQDERAARDAKRLLVSDERFAWLKLRLFLKINEPQRIMNMRNEVRKINGYAAFSLCLEHNMTEAAAALIDSIANARDQEKARIELSRIVRL